VGFANWRPALLIYGLVGFVVAAVFWMVFRDWPRRHPLCNRAERELIERGRPAGAPSSHGKATRVPLRQLVTSRSMWLMCLCQWGTNVGWAFLVTWLPIYLMEVKGIGQVARGGMVTTALTFGMVGMLLGGVVTDVAVRKLGVRWGRSLPLVGSRFVAMLAYLACLRLDSPWLLTAAFAVVAFFTDLGTGASWAYMQDVGGRHVGSILGWANMWGNLGAFAIAGVIPWVLAKWDSNGDWHEVFLVCAAGFLVSGIAALGIDASVPIAPCDEKEAPAQPELPDQS
jgi:nitrate/nitrite transporter NarK